jgi:predicted ATP-dependent protease
MRAGAHIADPTTHRRSAKVSGMPQRRNRGDDMGEGQRGWDVLPEQVRRTTDPARLGFDTTANLTPIEGLSGQARAEEAIDFALGMPGSGYNLYIAGQPGSGRRTSALKRVQALASQQPAASDWCYLYHFDQPSEPLAVELPSGSAPAFAHDVEAFVVGCRRELRRAFTGDAYRRQHAALLQEVSERQAEVLAHLQQEALAHGFALMGTPMGLTPVPLKRAEGHGLSDGQTQSDEQATATPMTPEEFAGLPAAEQRRITQEHDLVEEAMAQALPHLRALEEEARQRVHTSEHSTAEQAVATLAAELSARYTHCARIGEYVRYMAADFVAHATVLAMTPAEDVAAVGARPESDGAATSDMTDMTDMTSMVATGSGDGTTANEAGGGPASDLSLLGSVPDADLHERPDVASLLRRYRVNVLATHQAEEHASIVQEINPTHLNLVGRIEFGLSGGLPFTDHLMIKAGALHRANGGYLLLQAQDLLSQRLSWGALKRVLRFGVIGIESSEELQSVPVSAALRPEPIPIRCKIVLIGDQEIYAALATLDPEFHQLFAVRADFEADLPRTPETEHYYARIAGDAAQCAKAPPLTAEAVALLIEEGSRWAGDQERLSASLARIQDLVREACQVASQEHAEITTRAHLRAALSARERRMSLTSERLDAMILQDTIMIATTGTAVGQVNGLTVLSTAEYAFGKPARITARTTPGAGGIVNLERETLMSGPAHSKGILILSGYLAGTYAPDYPLTVSASICFEQVYGEIEGDSASSAELYAILSSLAQLPIRQSLAVTGSVNQYGEVQAVGGVNEKIEGFFTLCQARGLTGDQGVLIPAANGRHLMLREAVVEAIKAGQFHVYVVRTIDEGIELLTGVAAGTRGVDGAYPAHSVNECVSRRLRAFFDLVGAYSAMGQMSVAARAKD